MKSDDIIYGLSEISLYLSNIGREDFAQTIEDACKKLELLKEQEADAEIIRRCREGSTVKFLGKGVVVLNYQWWLDILKKRVELSPVPTKEELLKEQDNCENCAIAIEDRQPVVRCKDCVKHLDKHETELNGELYRYCELHKRWTTDDWYCADGERR